MWKKVSVLMCSFHPCVRGINPTPQPCKPCSCTKTSSLHPSPQPGLPCPPPPPLRTQRGPLDGDLPPIRRSLATLAAAPITHALARAIPALITLALSHRVLIGNRYLHRTGTRCTPSGRCRWGPLESGWRRSWRSARGRSRRC
jgi:hypothetical protein